jgi:biotin transport system substrate-specific component
MKMKTREMILTAFFAALTAAGAFITIPLPYIPLTLQFFFCTLSGVVLGSRLGMLSQIVYVAIGLVGLPVFAGGQGGFTYIFKPSFGFLIGFIIAAYVVGKIVESSSKINFSKLFIAQIIGLLAVYIVGVSYMLFIVNIYLAKSMTLMVALKAGVIPFVIADLVKILLSTTIALQVIPALRKAGLVNQS